MRIFGTEYKVAIANQAECLTELCGSALVHGRGISTLWGQMYELVLREWS